VYYPRFRRVYQIGDPTFTFTASYPLPMKCWMICVRDVEASVGEGVFPLFPGQANANGFFIFNYVGKGGDPGATGHTNDFVFKGNVSGETGGGALTVMLSSSVLLVTTVLSTYPHPFFPQVTWDLPVITPDTIYPTAYTPVTEVASNSNGDKVWAYRNIVPLPPAPPPPWYPVPHGEYPDFVPFQTAYTVSNTPTRTDRRWTFYTNQLFTYEVDQSYQGHVAVLNFFSTPTGIVVHVGRATATALGSAGRIRRLPEGAK